MPREARHVSCPPSATRGKDVPVPCSIPCGWHCFLSVQVFVANPNKTQPILDILLKNQTKLIEFLSKFQNDRTEDEQFNDEKTYLVKQIRDLKRPAQQEA